MGREGGGNRRRPNRPRDGGKSKQKQSNSDDACTKTVLVLHGSRQTGQLLLGRMTKLRKSLQQIGIKLVAADGPFDHPEDPNLRQWWERKDNAYRGLETSMQMLQDLWDTAADSQMVGILGFSQGARLAHLIALLNQSAKAALSLPSSQQHTATTTTSCKIPFEGLQFAILVAGYEAPVPDGWDKILKANGINAATETTKSLDSPITIPSLHIWGLSDSLIPTESSQAVTNEYTNPICHEHEGGHHVPMKNPSITAYMDFVQQLLSTTNNSGASSASPDEKVSNPASATTSKQQLPGPPGSKTQQKKEPPPDEETAQAQQDEVEALTAIYPEEVTMISKVTTNEDTGESTYQHPISYQIALHPEDEEGGSSSGHWPKHPLALGVTYPYNYPSDEALPNLKLLHENNVMEFPSAVSAACLHSIQEAAEAERGMPCVLSCLYAAKEFLDSGQDVVGEIAVIDSEQQQQQQQQQEEEQAEEIDTEYTEGTSLLKQASPERIQQCNLEGLEIAEVLLGRRSPGTASTTTDDDTPLFAGKGGSWMYTIGLVGKPSAGKSTLFNSASAFARQRGDAENVLGGAAMAARPFTTIDPNLGYCPVPAPDGSCPEEGAHDNATKELNIGCTHGRDSKGRRLLPVLLKDVAGLVPGAYQGRGRGNKFLNDLTDADVLVHVVDASGTADSEGNTVGEEEVKDKAEGQKQQSQPLQDLAWVRNELCEWVFNNVVHKWDSVKRRGRSKLSGMFSGYGQTSAVVSEVLNSVEKHMEKTEQRDHALDHLDEWDAGDVHRLVSAFLGVRFPMALALNKYDLPSSTKHVEAIQSALPLHGAHVGVPLCARSEMSFIRHHMLRELKTDEKETATEPNQKTPLGTWQCLQSAMSLRQPVLVFPVNDMTTYQPLPGMLKIALGDPSLPSPGMIACLQASGGSMPSLWDPTQKIYVASSGTHAQKTKQGCALRDALLMKPGSTVEDVFLTLKRLGALGGEFVRAEAAGDIDGTSKQIKKDSLVTRRCCILKIMTTKRNQWQQLHGK